MKARRSFPSFIILPAYILGMALSPALAKTHPVSLDKNVDGAKCLECHEDKTKGKAVHSAIAMGCLSCHEVRVNKGVTRIKLITATAYGLCLTCHADKNAADLKGRVHPPAVRDCLQCHDPHTSDNKNQLLKPASGDAKQNLCLTCHDIGLNVPEKGSHHAALDMGCDTCHITHKTGTESKPENLYHLTKAAPALCIDCHDLKDEALEKTHRRQPFGSANCLECHDPHQSAVPKLMAKFMHTPFAEKSCELCHAPAKDGKVVLNQASVRDVCATCHDDKAKLIATAMVQHPGAAGDCTDCHSPHASAQPGLPKTNFVDICLTCHNEQADQMKKAHLHEPAFAQSCATCHEPHGGINDHLLRAQGNALCLECHGPDSKPARVENAALVTIFNGKVKLPDTYFVSLTRLPLKYNLGHPIQNHPTSDLFDPKENKVSVKLGCLSCHQPHASAQAGLLVKDQASNTAFCSTCHKASDFLKQGSGVR
jgi:predicted CXXCH cytochrome family protein